MFTERFLLWKVFPVFCLRWILQFSVLQCPPDITVKVKSQHHCNLLDTVKRLLAVWSKREFVQSASVEQQACIFFFILYYISIIVRLVCLINFQLSALFTLTLPFYSDVISLIRDTDLTAAVGLSLEKLKKEDLDATKDAMHLILQGVSCISRSFYLNVALFRPIYL